MKVQEILDMLGPPHAASQPCTEDTFVEVTKVYHEIYAPGLSALFESEYYHFRANNQTFPMDTALVEKMASFLKALESVKVNNPAEMASCGIMETRAVWALVCTPQLSHPTGSAADRTAMPPEDDAFEASNRVQVVEALLSGDYLATNPLTPPMRDPDYHKTRQFDFWYSLAEFIRQRDSPDAPPAVKAKDDLLGRMRQLLDGRENRDVLYSIAVVRDLMPKLGPDPGAATSQHLDETEPRNRLTVASKFLVHQAQVGGGTTNVVRRLSEIATRAFVDPGLNVARRS